MLKFPHEYQLGTKDCGPTCIKIVAEHYGKCFSLQYLLGLCNITEAGVSLFEMVRVCGLIGLQTACFKLDFADMKKMPLPAIVHWENKHFIVIYKIKNNRIYVSDPGRGLLKYDQKSFTKGWLGGKIKWAVLAIEPMSNFNNDH